MRNDRVEQIYLNGLARLESAPDYHYRNIKRRSKLPEERGMKEVRVLSKSKHFASSDL